MKWRQDRLAHLPQPGEALLRGSVQGVLVLAGGVVALANAAAAAMFGVPDERALCGRPTESLFDAESAARLLGLDPARSPTQPPQDERLRLAGRDAQGGTLALEAVALPVAWNGQPALQLTLQDLTPLERVRAELAERDRQFRHLIDSSLQGIYVHREHRFLFANKAFAEIFGYDGPEELLALGDVLRCYAPHERERLLGYYRQRIAGGLPPVRYEFQGLRKDGTLVWLENLVRVVDWNGEQAILATVIDISERKRVEQELRVSEEKYRNLIEGSIQGILIQRDGRPLFVNPAFAEIFGFASPEEIYALDSLVGLAPTEQHARMRAYAEARLRGDPAPSSYVSLGRRKDGSLIWLENIVKVVRWDGTPAIQVTVVDVTERVRAEQALRDSEAQLRRVTRSAPLVLWSLDREGVFLLSEGGGLELIGLRPGEVVGRSVFEVYRDEPAAMDVCRRAIAGETVSRQLALGEVVFDLWVTPRYDQHGEVQGAIGVAIDITERTRAERELEASQRLLRTVLDTIPHSVYMKDADARFLMVNRAFAETLGTTPEAVIGERMDAYDYGDEATHAMIREMDRKVLEEGRPVVLEEFRVRLPGGQEAYRHGVKYPLFDQHGGVAGLVGLTEDITQRKASEGELRASQRLLQTVFDTIPHAIFVKDTAGRFRMVNDAFARFYGLPADKVVGLHHNQLPQLLQADINLFDASDAELLRSGNPVTIPEARIELADGRRSIRHITKMPLRDDEGRIHGIVGVSEDITERKRAEEELRASRMLLQTVFDLLPLWVFVKDRQRRFLMVNRKMREDHRLAHDVEPGTRIDLSPTIGEEEKAFIYRLDETVLETGRQIEVPEVQITLPTGETRLFRTVRMPLRDGEGGVTGILGIAEDITERKRTEQAMQQAQKLESLGVLAGGVAHDFNNLLVSIMGNANLAMLDLPADSPAQSAIGRIETAGQRAAELCRQMLAYAGKGSFELTRLDLNRLIEEMTRLLRVSIGTNVVLEPAFDDTLPQVEADPTQIRQVVMNLVINASEAIGEQPGTITLSTGMVHAGAEELTGYIKGEALPEGDYVFLEVADTGAGIGRETLNRIFDPFFTTKFTGRGLGLAAVLGIISAHRGAMRVTSQQGHGSRFRMLLPAVEGHVEASPPPAEPQPWNAGGTVLLVDDESAIREVVGDMLRKLGFEVRTANDGSEGWERFRAAPESFTLVLLDMMMPGMDGPEMLRRLRALGSDVRVVLMSGFSEVELHKRFGDVPCAGILQKPFTIRALREKLAEVLG